MWPVVILSLKRSKLLFSIMTALYLPAFLQLDVFLLSRLTTSELDPLFSFGFLVAMLGYFMGLLGVQFLALRHFMYEMGNLETLGYRRLQYLLFYVAQFILTCLLAWLLSIIVFSILYAVISELSLPLGQQVVVHLTSALLLLALIGVTLLLFGWIHSALDPFLLLKEKL